MPFRFATPVKTADQGEFPFAALTLVVSPAFRPDQVEAQIVLRAQPYDVRDGAVVRPMEDAETELEGGEVVPIRAVSATYDREIVFGAGYADAVKNPRLAKALATMGAALQEFLLTEASLQEGAE